MRILSRAVFLFCMSFAANVFAQTKPIKIGLVLDKGGKDDKSFNASAYLGAKKAEKELGISLKVVEVTDDSSFAPMLRNFTKSDFDLIISIGFAQAEAVKNISAKNPQQRYAIIDSEIVASNVTSVLFQEHEGAYLVGAMAALNSKTGQLGFIGGMDIPLIRRFQMGYEAGAKFVNPKVTVSNQYIGVSGDAWNNPPRAKELAVTQYNSGVDVIFGAAGASNMGILDAAEDKKKLAIGVDSNQNGIKPGYVLTSMLKRVDVAVFDLIEKQTKKQFKAGTMRLGLANNGVDFAMDQYNEKLVSQAALSQVNKIKLEIISGKIKVPDSYDKKPNK